MKRQFLGSSHLRRGVFVMNSEGRIVRSHDAENPQEVWMLSDQSILLAWRRGVRRIAPDGSVLWSFDVEAPDEVPSLQVLPNGDYLIGIAGRCSLLLMTPDGIIRNQWTPETTGKGIHEQFRFCRMTESGTLLIPFTSEGAVRELDLHGKPLYEITGLPSPICALRLPDANTLVSGKGGLFLFSPSGKMEWKLDQDDLTEFDLSVAAGIQLLRNGNIVFTNWGSQNRNGRKAAHIFEVNRKKEVVWLCDSPQIANAGQCQLLTPDFNVSNECILR